MCLEIDVVWSLRIIPFVINVVVFDILQIYHPSISSAHAV